MWTVKLSNTAIALTLVSAVFLLTGCASTTNQVAYPAECPKPAQPDPRLMEEPLEFVELDEIEQLESDALPTITTNNRAFERNRTRYKELQLWIRGRAQ